LSKEVAEKGAYRSGIARCSNKTAASRLAYENEPRRMKRRGNN
jgi:hypothetical protein